MGTIVRDGLRYGSVCSGVEAASMAWSVLSWEAAFFSEIEPFPCAVLKHHYPSVPNHGDMTKFKDWPDHAIDLLVGGTPCQSFSVAGLRAGLADPRGNLMLTYLAIAAKYQPRWLLWENVPGVLSSADGRDFGTFLGALGQLGYGYAYRVLDAQFCRALGYAGAVPQRRRRVFVIGYLGDWRRAAAVLFDAASLRGDSAPRREAGQGIAPTISARTKGGGGLGTDFDCDGGLVASDVSGTLSLGAHPGGFNGQDAYEGKLLAFGGNNTSGSINVSTALQAHAVPHGRQDFGSETFIAVADTLTSNGDAHSGFRDEKGLIPFDTTQITSKANRSSPQAGDASHPLAAGVHPPAIAFNPQAGGKQTSLGYDPASRIAGTLEANQTPAIVIQAGAVRENPDSGPDGIGVRQDGASYTIEARAEVQAVAFQSSQSGVRVDDVHATLDSNNGSRRHNGVIQDWAVRRLTPTECCRLQGFPDTYFDDVLYRGKKPADGPIYKALGNSMAVNVMRVIGSRIAMIDAIDLQSKA